MGNKKKLIEKGLTDLFPKNINTFVDLFAGSGIVSMNVNANKYILNDFDKNLFSLYSIFKMLDKEQIINHIEKNINKYDLARERTKRNVFTDKDKIEQYKIAYTELRTYYNQNKILLDFYTLMFYSFSQQFRFNSKGEFNMPCGNDCFSEKNKEYISNGCDFFLKENVKIANKDFRELKPEILRTNDFVYLDPPYSNTLATYNENSAWNYADDIDLFDLCEKLNSLNIKWAISNVFENKGNINQHLIDWCEKNNWNVFSFGSHTYMACGKGNANSKEVLITNYKKKEENL